MTNTTTTGAMTPDTKLDDDKGSPCADGDGSQAYFERQLTGLNAEQWSDSSRAVDSHGDPNNCGSEVQRIVAEAGINALTELLSAAIALEDPQRAAVVIEEAWRAQPAAMVVLAAFLRISSRLPVEMLGTWAGRLRVRGARELCPLLSRAKDPSHPIPERSQAAVAAWERFFDPEAKELLELLGTPAPEAIPPYYLYTRPEVVAKVPFGARSVLDVGCAAGQLGASIKYRQPADVCGVELEASAAAHAENVLDEVHLGNLDEGVLDEIPGPFDAIVAADVLEHLRDPWTVVRQLADMLRPGGVMVTSIPNIANLGVLSSIVSGRFDYQDAGILDRTHLRFFTRATAAEMIKGAGLEIENIEAIRDPTISPITLPRQGERLDLNIGQLGLKQMDAAKVEELSTVQFVFTARKRQTLRSERKPRIWDCVLFFNELEMLEARLTELEDVIDHVVIVESPQTFRGDGKPLVFAESKDRFVHFDVEFHHVVVQFDRALSAWERERTQRDGILQAVSGANPDDLLLCCDVDEIVSRGAIEKIITETASGPVSLEMALYYYSRRWRSPQCWVHPKALRARDLPVSLERLRLQGVLPVVRDAGWHLSYFGGTEQIHKKLGSYSHAEYDTPHIHGTLPTLVEQGLTVHGIQLQRADDDFPAHISKRFPLDDDFQAHISKRVLLDDESGGLKAPVIKTAAQPQFIEEWYPEPQLRSLVGLLQETLAADVPGELVEIGCWEGRSTVALARASKGSRRDLYAVDWWLGNIDEGDAHPSVVTARQRDVYGTFLHNISPYPHVQVRRQEGGEFLRSFGRQIAFVHLDAGHTYAATKELIDEVLPMLAPGGIICGDDYLNSHAGRHDLGGGVEAAVRDAFQGDASTFGNLWFYRRRVDGDPAWWPESEPHLTKGAPKTTVANGEEDDLLANPKG